MDRTIKTELEEIRQRGLYRQTRLIRGRQGGRVNLDGRDVLMLCSNNYLGLADHPRLSEASIQAVEKYGTSSAASRLVSGTMELHEELEHTIAAFKQTESALVFNSGYAANVGVISALVGRGDLIFSDRLNHASIIDGSLLSGAKLVRYTHNNVEALKGLLEKYDSHQGRKLVVTDGVFSMDGDIAPLKEIAAQKQSADFLLMVDDAHGCGVLGDNGRGSAESLGVLDQIDIHIGTFGKALGSFGAYAALSSELREYLINRARSFIFSTSMPPAVLAASNEALCLVQSDEGRRLRKQLQGNTDIFRDRLRDAGFDLGEGTTQIIPVMCGDTDVTMQFSQQLLDRGIYLQGIRPPTVPSGSCRLRCTVMATHKPEELRHAADEIVSVGKELGVI